MTTYFYSASAGGFYTPDINPTMPTDVLEITEEYYQSLLEGQSGGKVIAADAQGNPVLTDPTVIFPTYTESRQAAYPSIADQLDMQYWDHVNGTTNWEEAITAIKAKYPK
jgi:hypothetical protein